MMCKLDQLAPMLKGEVAGYSGIGICQLAIGPGIFTGNKSTGWILWSTESVGTCCENTSALVTTPSMVKRRFQKGK